MTTSRIPQYLRLVQGRIPDKGRAAKNRVKAIKRFNAPKAIEAIADGLEDVGHRSVAIRRTSSCSKVALLNPHLTPYEFEGLAYRLQILKRNRTLSSVLIVADDRENYRGTNLTSDTIMVSEQDREFNIANSFPPAPGQTWYVAGGYDPMAIDARSKGPALAHLTKLALAVRGDGEAKSKIPCLFVPNGAITDGGAAFMLSSYVLVTENTSFSILNPARGLTFDPTGMSWILPRIGQEFQQPSAECRTACALILGLTGYEADYKDMVFTGLATHCLSSPYFIEELETHLIDTPTWEQQALIKEPKRYLGATARTMQPEIYHPDYDHNAQFRNVQVAEIVNTASCLSAEGKDILVRPYDELAYDMVDPSLHAESYPAVADLKVIESDLVNYAFSFKDIFNREGTVVGLLERLKEVANSTDTSIDDRLKVFADGLVKRLERQSPLALACTFRLLWLGAGKQETLESCIQREQIAQRNLFDGNDFRAWREAQAKSGRAGGRPVDGVKWQYQHVSQVPSDHVAEILRHQTE